MNTWLPTATRQGLFILGAIGLLLIGTLPATAQTIPGTSIFSPSTRPVDGTQLGLSSTNRAMTLDVSVEALRSASTGEFTLRAVPLAPGFSPDLELRPWNVIEPGTTIILGTESGDVEIETTVQLWRGTVVGDPESDVFLSISDESILGHVTTVDRSYEISNDQTVQGPANGVIAALSYPTNTLPGSMIDCGVTEKNLADLIGDNWIDYGSEKGNNRVTAAADGIEFAATGAWEADVEYLALFPGATAAADYMVQLIADVSAVYERDLGVQLTIGHMKLWESASAPGYPYIERTIMGVALRETAVYWRDIDQATIERAFAHTFSGKPWVNPIGIAYLDVLCQQRMGAFSAITRTNTARDRRVVAHETGHNFGSNHTHHCGWGGQYNGAIHKCAPAEGGNCFSATQQEVGTIMSYCSQSELKFHPLVIDRLREKVRDADKCVSSARKLLIEPNVVIFQNSLKDVARDTLIETFFTNAGVFDDIEVTSVTQTGENTDQFEILEGLPPFTLKPGESQKISVRFKAERTDGARLVLTYKHTGLNPDVIVIIEGYASDAQPRLGLRNDNDMVDWGERLTGSLNDTILEGFYLNLGVDGSAPDQRATLFITDTRIEGPDALEFQLTRGTAPMQVEGTESMDVGFRYSPRSVGPKQAWLVVESNSNGVDGTLDSFDLVGNGKIGPIMQIAVADLLVDFGDVPRNESRSRRFENFFRNVGGEPLSFFADVYVTDGGEEDIFNSNNSGIGFLVPNDSINLELSFKPDAAGSLGLRKGYMDVEATDEDVNFTVSRDTIYLIGNVIGESSVTGDLEPDASFFVVQNPVVNDELVYFLAPAKGEANALFLISVVDPNGREVHRTPGRFTLLDGEHYSISTEGWPSGVYYLRVLTEGSIRGRKVTITR